MSYVQFCRFSTTRTLRTFTRYYDGIGGVRVTFQTSETERTAIIAHSIPDINCFKIPNRVSGCIDCACYSYYSCFYVIIMFEKKLISINYYKNAGAIDARYLLKTVFCFCTSLEREAICVDTFVLRSELKIVI